MSETRSVLVCGAAGDIGAAIARLLAATGHALLLADLPSERLDALGRELGAPVLGLDLRDRDAAEGVLERALVDADLDGAVSVSGVNTRRRFTEVPAEEWDRVQEVTLRGTFVVLQCVARAMRRRGRAGSIVTISSIGAWRPHTGLAHYEAAKAGVEALTRAAALDLADDRIRVNSVAPGVVDTAMTAATLADEEYRGRRLARIPLGRFGRPDDVAECVRFLLGDGASWMTGSTLVLDGGQSIA